MQSHPFHLIGSKLSFNLPLPFVPLHFVHASAVLIYLRQVTVKLGNGGDVL